MKKALLFLLFLSAPLYYTVAQQTVEVEFQVSSEDNSGTHNPLPKTPIKKPTIIQDGYTLTFVTSCDNCTLYLINENNEEEYSIVIPSGTTTLVLPSYLSGEYRIEIHRGNFCFWGYINL